MSQFQNLLVAIGASAGGFKEIVRIVEELPESFQGCLVVALHREPQHENTFADILERHSRVRISEPVHNGTLSCSTIYVGAPSERIEVESGGRFGVEVDVSFYARIHRIDDLFFSVAETAGQNSVGVVLSGMLCDGVAGLAAIRNAGGRCIVQDPLDASFDSMPINALNEVEADFVGTAKEIAGKLIEIASDRNCIERS